MITRKERLPHGFLSFSASVLGVGSGAKYVVTGSSWNNGRICKYIITRGIGLVLVNNNAQALGIFIVTKYPLGTIEVKRLYQTNGDYIGSFWRDDSNNLYIKHSENWGSHLIIWSTSIEGDGYITSSSDLTEIPIQSM